MKIDKLERMVGGWFMGDFSPTCVKTAAAEVACKHYKAGAAEKKHVHRIATEITLVVSGRVRMNGVEIRAGEMVTLEPGEPADFSVLEDAITVVVKTPSVMGDKYVLTEAAADAGAGKVQGAGK